MMHRVDGVEEEFSLFESAADFFSLVALSAIFAVVTFGSAPGTSSNRVVREGARTGPGQPIASNILMIAFERSGDDVLLTLIHPGTGDYKAQPFNATPEGANSAMTWLNRELESRHDFSSITLRLAESEERPAVVSLFMTILRSIKAQGIEVDIGV